MSEQATLAAKVHEILANHNLGADAKIAEIEAMLPAPPRPTMADMTPVERIACKWMQADVEDTGTIAVLVNPWWEDGSARVMWPGGFLEETDWDRVTPRPDLPRMTWPGTEKPDPAPALPDGWRLADHPDYGRVIVTTTPNSDGRVYYVLPSDGIMGNACDFCLPSELTYLDGPTTKGADTVPPSTLAVGSVWHDADALTGACEESGRDQIVVTDCDGDSRVWSADANWWATAAPIPEFAPYTIIDTGKGADQ